MKKEDWQAAFGQPSASFDARFRQTLERIDQKEEKTMKHLSVRAVVIALALVLALTGVAYAASQGWMIGDYLNGRYGDNVNAPRDFSTGYDLEYTQELNDLTFRIRDAIVDGGNLNAIVEISRTDGRPAVIRGEDCMEDDLIANLYPDLTEDDPTYPLTVGQYALERNLPM